jgi:protein phosphatase
LIPELLDHAEKLVRAVAALHRRSIIHRDIKPANVHLGNDGQLRILDLGVAQSGLEADIEHDAPQAGTPSYLAPEQFQHAPATPQTDLYAVGVTLYFLLTRHYPYGEIAHHQNPRFGDPVPPSRYRPDMPLWLEHVLIKACARDTALRFETAEEFLLALQRGGASPLPAPAATPLLTRDPVLVWRSVALVALVLNVLLLYLLVVR